MKKIIPFETYERAEHYKLFKSMDNPHFNVCMNIEITHFYDYIKKNELPFFETMIYVVMKAVNGVKEFRYRIEDDQIVMYDVVSPSTTIMPQKGIFGFCSFDYTSDYIAFRQNMDKVKESFGDKVNLKDEIDVNRHVFLTSLPWITFTSVQHPMNLKRPDSIPRIAWGKYSRVDEKVFIPFSVQAHHALLDGYHVHLLVEKIEYLMNHMETTVEILKP